MDLEHEDVKEVAFVGGTKQKAGINVNIPYKIIPKIDWEEGVLSL